MTADQIPGLRLFCSPDFHSADFYEEDFHTSVDDFELNFSSWLFERLPIYFKVNDSYKDTNDAGLLERYLATIGHELDEGVVSQIPCYLKIIDPTECESKFLTHISDVLGNPPDIFNDVELYRKLLNYIVAVYKIKGTIAAYELFFSLLGYGVIIEEIPSVNDESYYDIGGEYDTGDPLSVYDNSLCNPCSYYTIVFYPTSAAAYSLTQDVLDRLQVAIEFNEPINAQLSSITFAVLIEDNLGINITDDQTHISEPVILYDLLVPDEYDDVIDYDNDLLIGSGIVNMVWQITSLINGSNNFEITSELINNFAPETLDIPNSPLTVTGMDGGGDIIYQLSGILINVSFNGSNPVAEIVATEHIIGSPSSIQISGQLRLSDGKVAAINSSIQMSGVTPINVYFI